MDSYKDALTYLFTHLPMFQRTGPAAYKHSLENTFRLDRMYSHPHQSFRAIHVAGTNGKGSVSHMLASVLQSAGYRTGLFTSPHLKDFRERIRINGEMVPENFVAAWTENFRMRNLTEGINPSFFELTAAMAFDYFARENVDIAVIEVGLGGRLDSTNIITPLVSIITNIGYDHTSLLGETLPLIAAEKAGIIKKDIPVVVSKRQAEVEEVFISKAKVENAPLYFADHEYSTDYGLIDLEGNQVFNFTKNGEPIYLGLKTDLPGMYQRHNIPAVLKTIDLLRETGINVIDDALYKGLSSVRQQTGLQGRWQVIGANPRMVCDTGHNEDGIRAVMEQIRQTQYRNLHIVFGVVADKDPSKVLNLLPRKATYYFCKADIPRAMGEIQLQQKAAEYGLKGKAYSTVIEAFNSAKAEAGSDDFIFVGGSTFVVGEIL